ncbi:MAG: LysM peptidoglycan-binding domain-containing protein [Nitrospirae bacterium]|nr:LysM peptidoglycan-binding domain-containing protein [Nitrospirota bacterium]
MLKKVKGTFILMMALTMILLAISGIGSTAQAGERIFPAWFFRSHSSEDTELWGNKGIAPGGYFVGGPRVETVVTTTVSEPATTTVAATTTAAEATTGKSKELVATHKVVKGESLWYIAGYKKIYGDPTKWPLIYQANKDKIKNPNLIYPDQVLRIPR